MNLDISKMDIHHLADGEGMRVVYQIDNFKEVMRLQAKEAMVQLTKRLTDDLYERTKDDFISHYCEKETREIVEKAVRDKLKEQLFEK